MFEEKNHLCFQVIDKSNSTNAFSSLLDKVSHGFLSKYEALELPVKTLPEAASASNFERCKEWVAQGREIAFYEEVSDSCFDSISEVFKTDPYCLPWLELRSADIASGEAQRCFSFVAPDRIYENSRKVSNLLETEIQDIGFYEAYDKDLDLQIFEKIIYPHKRTGLFCLSTISNDEVLEVFTDSEIEIMKFISSKTEF